jgi:hypothetical protein
LVPWHKNRERHVEIRFAGGVRDMKVNLERLGRIPQAFQFGLGTRIGRVGENADCANLRYHLVQQLERQATVERGDNIRRLIRRRLLRNPISGDAGCCARAASGHAAAPPSPAMNSLRRIHPLISRVAGNLSKSLAA